VSSLPAVKSLAIGGRLSMPHRYALCPCAKQYQDVPKRPKRTTVALKVCNLFLVIFAYSVIGTR